MHTCPHMRLMGHMRWTNLKTIMPREQSVMSYTPQPTGLEGTTHRSKSRTRVPMGSAIHVPPAPPQGTTQ